MCGIFGYITRAGQGPEIARLRRIALVTQTRGAHAFGLAWVDADGAICTFKQPGPAKDHLDLLDRCRNAVALVGHCRYATHGAPEDNRNNHPHPMGAGVFVHNGVVYNHRQLADDYQLKMQTDCDSEVLGLLATRCGGTLAQRAAWVANQAVGDLAILGLWARPTRLLVARRGRPLHVGVGAGGYYFASLPQGLPGKPVAVTDATSRLLRYEQHDLRLESQPFQLAQVGGH